MTIETLIREITEAAAALHYLIEEVEPDAIPALEAELQEASEVTERLSHAARTYLDLRERFSADQITAAWEAGSDPDIADLEVGMTRVAGHGE